jgi:hypothetical protein
MFFSVLCNENACVTSFVINPLTTCFMLCPLSSLLSLSMFPSNIVFGYYYYFYYYYKYIYIFQYSQISSHDLIISHYEVYSVCRKACLDHFGEHAIHCRELPNFKYRYDFVKDVLCDIF